MRRSSSSTSTSSTVSRSLGFLLVSALVLTGCAGIPRDGSVRVGQTAAAADALSPVFLPSRPVPGASREDILRGFVDAATSPENDYAIAREFLTPVFAEDWDADAQVTVDDASSRSITALVDDRMELTVTPVAEVDETGQYSEVESSAAVPLTYQFDQVQGEWRLRAAPIGTVIDQNAFVDVFSAAALYFYDPEFNYLVPDLRWFTRGASLPTRIVNGILAGPSPWLTGAVTSAFPQGSALSTSAVQVVSRDAKVDLNTEALSADRLTLARMRAQLVSSLPSGMTVTITIDQNDQNIIDLGTAAPIVNPRVDARALVLRAGRFGFLASSGDALTTVEGISEAVGSLKPTAVTLSADQQSAAILTADGVFDARAGQPARLLDARPGLLAPTIDDEGYVWSVPADSPGSLLVFDSAGEAISAPNPWPEASTLTAFRLSRDGTRLVALLRAGAETRVIVAAVIRDQGVPVGFGTPLLLSSDDSTPVDVTWIDDLTIAHMSRLSGGEERITVNQLGGVSNRLESTTDGQHVVGSNSTRDLRLLTTAGALLVQRGAGWQERIRDVELVATQQGLSR